MGTHGRRLLIYGAHYDGASSGSDGRRGAHSIAAQAGDYELRHSRAMDSPVLALSSGDVSGCGADSLAVCTLRGLHFMRSPLEVAAEKVVATVALLEELRSLRAKVRAKQRQATRDAAQH